MKESLYKGALTNKKAWFFTIKYSKLFESLKYDGIYCVKIK